MRKERKYATSFGTRKALETVSTIPVVLGSMERVFLAHQCMSDERMEV